MSARRPLPKGSPRLSAAPRAPRPAPEIDEAALVQAAQRDPAKFEALYELHFERVYAYVVRRVRDRTTAEDVTAEVFQKALAALPNYEWRGAPLAAWLFRIAANAIVDQGKRDRRDAPLVNDVLETASELDLQVIENRAQLFRAVSTLPEEQRRIIQQRFIEERSIREIAHQLDKTEGAIKQLQFRALRTLRAQMGGSRG
jgi:RNA polymerase sigma-70 factor (ECF subfamily)